MLVTIKHLTFELRSSILATKTKRLHGKKNLNLLCFAEVQFAGASVGCEHVQLEQGNTTMGMHDL